MCRFAVAQSSCFAKVLLWQREPAGYPVKDFLLAKASNRSGRARALRFFAFCFTARLGPFRYKILHSVALLAQPKTAVHCIKRSIVGCSVGLENRRAGLLLLGRDVLGDTARRPVDSAEFNGLGGVWRFLEGRESFQARSGLPCGIVSKNSRKRASYLNEKTPDPFHSTL
jgi:hypothetical protein